MRSSFTLLAAAAVASTVASPLLMKKSNFDAPSGGDVDILNYALTLEYLERKFYQEGLKNFTSDDFCKAGFNATFYANLKEIYADEQSHVSLLATVLGDKAVKEATYSFPVEDAKSFVALSASMYPIRWELFQLLHSRMNSRYPKHPYHHMLLQEALHTRS